MSQPGMPGYTVRRMERPELDFALSLADAEGWNPGRADAGPFWAADPRGFFIGLLDGAPVAVISAVRYPGDGTGPAFGFVGLYIVRPELRGQGLGLRLWNAALAACHAPTIGLDAVPAQQDAYRRDGFQLVSRNVRYAGEAGGTPPDEARPLSETPFAEVLAYDRRCFPTRREAFLRAWLDAPGHVALGLTRAGALAGYGVARLCRQGTKIGPLFADDDATARTLFRALCAAVRPGAVYLDAPQSNPAAVRLAEDHGMRPVFETGRMYRGPEPAYDLGRVFGVTSFELG